MTTKAPHIVQPMNVGCVCVNVENESGMFGLLLNSPCVKSSTLKE